MHAIQVLTTFGEMFMLHNEVSQLPAQEFFLHRNSGEMKYVI